MLLKKGDKAPDFKGLDQYGNEISSADLYKKKLVIYFYPKANTPGCTDESCSFRDSFKEWTDLGFQILGVSADCVHKQNKFAEKYALPFPLLADENRDMIKAFGVWGSKKLYGREYEGILRYTFVIDEHGYIMQIIDKVKTKEASKQLFKELKLK
jgi:peroxiredoxin Q/BCP